MCPSGGVAGLWTFARLAGCCVVRSALVRPAGGVCVVLAGMPRRVPVALWLFSSVQNAYLLPSLSFFWLVVFPLPGLYPIPLDYPLSQVALFDAFNHFPLWLCRAVGCAATIPAGLLYCFLSGTYFITAFPASCFAAGGLGIFSTAPRLCPVPCGLCAVY